MRRRLLVPFIAVAVAAAFLVIGALTWWEPFADQERDVVAGTPGLGPIFDRDVMRLPPGETGCIAPVRLTTDTHSARLRVFLEQGPAVPLRIAVRAGSHRASDIVRQYRTGSDALVTGRIAPPSADADGEVCVTNLDRRRAVGLVGTRERRSLTVAALRLRGRVWRKRSTELTLLAGRRESIATRFGDLLSHAATLTGAVPVWLAWIVALTVLIGLPVGVLGAFLLAALRDERVS